MTFEEMMQAVDTFRSWPLDVQQYCVKIGGHFNLQVEATEKPIQAKAKIDRLRNHFSVWDSEDSKQLLSDVSCQGGPRKKTYEKLCRKYGRTWHSLKNQYEKLTGARK